jgi:hypothetical protein
LRRILGTIERGNQSGEKTEGPKLGDFVVYAVAVLLPLVLAGALKRLAQQSKQRANPKRRVPNWVRLIAGNVLVFLLLVSLVFLALESYYRFGHDTTDSFAQTRVSKRWFERYYHRNNASFRDSQDYYFRRRPGKSRVSFIGDSFTAGHGIANVEDRFGNRVRHVLGDRWEVHVLADIGRDTGAELKVVEGLIRDGYEFDRVVLVYCLNDVNDLVAETVEPAAEAGSPGFFVEHSFAINAFYYRIKSRVDPNVANYYQSVRGAYDGPLWERQQERLTLLRDACDDAGGRLWVVVFPFMHSLGPGYDYRPVHEQLHVFWEQLDVPCLDLLATFEEHLREGLTVNRYDAHPNERAHELAAEAIVEFLAAYR